MATPTAAVAACRLSFVRSDVRPPTRQLRRQAHRQRTGQRKSSSSKSGADQLPGVFPTSTASACRAALSSCFNGGKQGFVLRELALCAQHIESRNRALLEGFANQLDIATIFFEHRLSRLESAHAQRQSPDDCSTTLPVNER